VDFELELISESSSHAQPHSSPREDLSFPKTRQTSHVRCLHLPSVLRPFRPAMHLLRIFIGLRVCVRTAKPHFNALFLFLSLPNPSRSDPIHKHYLSGPRSTITYSLPPPPPPPLCNPGVCGNAPGIRAIRVWVSSLVGGGLLLAPSKGCVDCVVCNGVAPAPVCTTSGVLSPSLFLSLAPPNAATSWIARAGELPRETRASRCSVSRSLASRWRSSCSTEVTVCFLWGGGVSAYGRYVGFYGGWVWRGEGTDLASTFCDKAATPWVLLSLMLELVLSFRPNMESRSAEKFWTMVLLTCQPVGSARVLVDMRYGFGSHTCPAAWPRSVAVVPPTSSPSSLLRLLIGDDT